MAWSATPDANDDEAPRARTLLTGYGTGGFKITTGSAKTQAYFDNGMQLAHAFARKAVISAFKRSELLDPACAICAWGEAWSRGPTINYSIGKKRQTEVANKVQRQLVYARSNWTGDSGSPDARAHVRRI